MTISNYVKSNLLLSLILLSLPASCVFLFYTQEWQWLLVTFISFQWTRTFGNAIAMHRYFGHKSFKTGKLRHIFLALSTIPLAAKSPISYAMNHRHHHLFADQVGKDTHSPQENIWSSLFGLWEFKNYAWFSHRGVTMRCRDLLRDPLLMWIEKNYYRVWVGLIITTCLISWKFCLFALLLPAGYFHIAAGCVNTLGHINIPGSYRNYDTPDCSHNHWLWGIITLGEGFHNNHHKQPNSACFGKHWWEFDPTWWIIKSCLATNLEEIELMK